MIEPAFTRLAERPVPETSSTPTVDPCTVAPFSTVTVGRRAGAGGIVARVDAGALVPRHRAAGRDRQCAARLVDGVDAVRPAADIRRIDRQFAARNGVKAIGIAVEGVDAAPGRSDHPAGRR